MINGIEQSLHYNSMIAASGSDVTDGFMIKLLAKLNIGGATVYITSTHVCTAMISLAIIIFALIVNRKIKKANVEDTPSGIVNISELIVETLDNFVESIMGKEAKRFVNYVSTLFIFVLLCNISGVLGLRAPTADYGMTLPLGLITFGMVHYCGIKKNKLKHFTDMCKPLPLTPINIVGEVAVPISLSFRLFGNVVSGTVLMGLVYGLLPTILTVAIPSFLHAYLDIFSGCLQAFVISMLTMVYVNDKIAD